MNIGTGSKKSSDFSTEKPIGSDLPDIIMVRDDELMEIFRMDDYYTFHDKKTGFVWSRRQPIIALPIEFEIIYLPPPIGHDSAMEKGFEE